MLTKYGFMQIDLEIIDNGMSEFRVFNVKPTFENISLLGEPKEIIDLIKSINDESLPFNYRYMTALSILDHCCEPKLPESFTGSFKITDKLKIKNPPRPELMNDVLILAKHCIEHGICGHVERDVLGGEKSEVTEFDPYEYINSAIEMFNVSRDEAANMTMTEYIMRVRQKPEYKAAIKEELEKHAKYDKRALEMTLRQREMDRKLKEGK